MRVYFERTGGFMGMRIVASFDTRELPEEEAQTLIDLLDEVEFFQLPSRLESPMPGMDQFHYVLTVSTEQVIEIDDDARRSRPASLPEEQSFAHQPSDDDDAEFDMLAEMESDEDEAAEQEHAHTVEFTDAAAPLEMLPLVRMLTRMARGQ